MRMQMNTENQMIMRNLEEAIQTLKEAREAVLTVRGPDEINEEGLKKVSDPNNIDQVRLVEAEDRISSIVSVIGDVVGRLDEILLKMKNEQEKRIETNVIRL